MRLHAHLIPAMLLLAGLLPAAAQTYNQTPGTVVGWGASVIPYVAPGTIFTGIAVGR